MRNLALYVILFAAMFSAGTAFAAPVSSSDLKATAFAAVTEAAIAPERNLVYCSTFRYAWKTLCEDVLKGALELDGAPDYAAALNAAIPEKPAVSEGSYLSMAGFGRDGIVASINAALSKKFGADAPKVDEKLGPTDILAYAFLYKNLAFAKEFESLENPIYFTDTKDGTKVEAFGVKKFSPQSPEHEALGRQVDILHYDEENRFVVRLVSKSADDELIIAKIDPAETLEGCWNAVSKLIAGSSAAKLSKGDTLQIPKLDLDIVHSFGELIGKKVTNKGFTGYFIRKAMQSVRFRLDEKGAILKSEAKIVMTKNGGSHGRRIVFDGPFFVMMKEKTHKKPYFILYAANGEVLKKK